MIDDDDDTQGYLQPKREWVGLTDAEVIEISHLALTRVQAARMTEAKLKEKTMNNIIKQPMLPNTIHFHHTMNNDNTEVMRITRTGVWVNPDLSIDDTAKAVLAALDSQIKVLVQAEREACAKVCDEVDKESQSQWPKRLATMIRVRGNT